MQLPYIPDEIFEVMHEFSVFLLKDDKHDLGYYRYYKRKGHYYMGQHSPDHPGMLHHWQVGMAGLIMAQLGGLLNLARNAVTSDEMIENMGEGELYDESTVIDLPENAVHEVPTPSLVHQQFGDQVHDIEVSEIIDMSESEENQLLPTLQVPVKLVPIPSLPPLQKI
jgi:hypothetical protein